MPRNLGGGGPRASSRWPRDGGGDGWAMAATILLVEDERKLRELVRSYLERSGFTVLSAASGAEALILVGSAVPDRARCPTARCARRDGRAGAALDSPDPDPDADGQGLGGRPDPRPGAGR